MGEDSAAAWRADNVLLPHDMDFTYDDDDLDSSFWFGMPWNVTVVVMQENVE